jgi:hypothetical protein
MFKKHGSIAPNRKTLLMLPLLLCAVPLWAQHGAHTHGKAELNLVLNADREIVAELISPAESVYGFEHAPRNAKEEEQMKAGLKRLRSSLSTMLVLEKKAGCSVTEIVEDSYVGAVESDHHHDEGSSGTHKHHEGHGHGEETEDSHDHHAEHGEEAAGDTHHRNVVIRWKVQCGTDLAGERITVNWNEALSDIHHMALTILTPTRQKAISLERSGEKIRL